ncbi:hypothetical protein [Sulfuriferula nivalis]|uniref:hypothetical protein n=1 Tax=Sulfuriferula nivalis TaxID=2675298 RepID=UPI0013894E07|nr:hypothetical protein [Sulfuriferula nivalis]
MDFIVFVIMGKVIAIIFMMALVIKGFEAFWAKTVGLFFVFVFVVAIPERALLNMLCH